MLIFYSIIVLAAVVLGYCKWAHQYWRRKKIPYLEPHLPFGNISNVVKRKEDIGTTVKQMYDEMKRRNWKHGGVYFFLSPNYALIDLDYIKNILTRDFNYFVDHPFYSNEKIEPVNGNLLNIKGEKWRKLRTKLTPTFTTAKMKMMFGTMLDCGVNLLGRVEEKCQRDEAIDIKDVLESFTMDIIRSCAFGLDLKLSEEDDSSFKIYSKKMLVVTKWQFIKSEFVSDFPRLANILRLKVLPKGVADFFFKTVTDIIEFREKNSVVRNDFMQLMIKLKNSKFVEESLTIEEIAAQSALFITASFETFSVLMTFTMYELAKNQDIQNGIRDEISSVLGNYEGKITYSALGEMKYMNKVLDEILRKYTPISFVKRRCVKDYKIPDEDIIIEKGTVVIIPIYGIHHDEEYYPDPEKFDPERFSEENKNSRHPYAHLPFGEGPRNCIGKRFGLMQSKVGLVSLLKSYRFTLNEETKEPFTPEVNSFAFTFKEKIWLNAQKI